MKKRPWFRFHLSTLIVLTVTAGALMWVNFRLQHGDLPLRFGRAYPPFAPWRMGMVPNAKWYGWPCVGIVTQPELELGTYSGLNFMEPPLGHELHGFSGIMINILTALAILTAVAVGWEWWVRRKGRSEDRS